MDVYTFTFNENATDIVSLQFITDLAVMLGFDADKTYTNCTRRNSNLRRWCMATVNNVFVCIPVGARHC